jgi:hypothetical protein
VSIYDRPLKSVLLYCVKRFVMLAAKLAGFKSCCVYLATYLLVNGFVTPAVWAGVVIGAMTGAVGTHVIEANKEGTIKRD